MIEHDRLHHRFTLEQDGHLAVLDYTLAGHTMTITHTGVPEAIGGRGLAGELNRAALEHARQAGWVVVPACSYTRAYVQRHPRYHDLVQE